MPLPVTVTVPVALEVCVRVAGFVSYASRKDTRLCIAKDDGVAVSVAVAVAVSVATAAGLEL